MIQKNTASKPLPPRPDGTSAPLRRLATVREACAYGRFSHTTCYSYINQGLIIAVKRGNWTLIDLDSIDAMNAALPRLKPKAAL